MITVTVGRGKYTVINDKGKLTALRHGEPWREQNLIGDNLVYWLAVELHAAREELRKQRPAITAVFDRDVWDALDVKGD